MKPLTKIAIVMGGYLLALLVAIVVMYIYATLVDSPERQASSGMAAFGDSLLFLAVFSIAAMPATVAALYFVRRSDTFWRLTSVVALCIAMTGISALLAYLFNFDANSMFYTWSTLSPLRILLAPFLAFGFFLCSLFAFTPIYRNRLRAATAIEAMIFIVWIVWILAFRR